MPIIFSYRFYSNSNHVFTFQIFLSCQSKKQPLEDFQSPSLSPLFLFQVGDQLLEVCGINMRNAPHEWAERVLGNCGDSITMHVQYNPHSKFDKIQNWMYILERKIGGGNLSFSTYLLYPKYQIRTCSSMLYSFLLVKNCTFYQLIDKIQQ